MNPYAPPRAPHAPPQAPQAPPKSSAVLVLAVIAIIWGALGLLGAPAAALIGQIARDPVSRRIHEVTWSGGFGTWMRVSVALSVVLAILLIVSGVGLIKARPWARLTSIVYAVATIALAVVGQVLSFAVLFPELERIASEYASNPIAQAGVAGGKVGGMVGGLFGLAFPVVLLVMMLRRSIRDSLSSS